MKHSAATGMVVFAILGGVIAWYACKAWLSHADIGSQVRKISGLRRGRSHNGAVAFFTFIVGVVLLYAVIHK